MENRFRCLFGKPSFADRQHLTLISRSPPSFARSLAPSRELSLENSPVKSGRRMDEQMDKPLRRIWISSDAGRNADRSCLQCRRHCRVCPVIRGHYRSPEADLVPRISDALLDCGGRRRLFLRENIKFFSNQNLATHVNTWILYRLRFEPGFAFYFEFMSHPSLGFFKYYSSIICVHCWCAGASNSFALTISTLPRTPAFFC